MVRFHESVSFGDTAPVSRANQAWVTEDVASQKVGDIMMDLLQAFVEVDLLEETRAAAIRIFRSLPRDETTLERFAQTGRDEPLLRSLADALSQQLAQSTVQDFTALSSRFRPRPTPSVSSPHVQSARASTARLANPGLPPQRKRDR